MPQIARQEPILASPGPRTYPTAHLKHSWDVAQNAAAERKKVAQNLFAGVLSAQNFYCISGAFKVSRSCARDCPPLWLLAVPREGHIWRVLHQFLNPTSPELIQSTSCTLSIAQTQSAPTARICGRLKSNGRDNAKSKTTLTRRSFGVNWALTHITKCATLHAF